MISRLLLLGLSCLTLAGCRQSGTRATGSAQLVAEPQSLTFGGVPIGKQRIQHLNLENASRFTVQATLEVAAPFQAPAQVDLLAGAEQDLEVTFAPGAQGPAEAELVVTWEGGRLTVPLSGEGLSPDACTPSRSCEDVTWDPIAGRCMRIASANGSACSNACLQEGSCENGNCVGTAIHCDDGNACTVDACDPFTGCTHVPRSCTPSTNSCVAAVCNPVLGCGETVAPDGTQCGSTNDCAVAHVCIAGTCTSRAAADGMECGSFSPCRDKGRCQAGSCIRPPATAMSPRWSFTASAGGMLYPGPISADGHLYVLEKHLTYSSQQEAWILDFDIPTGVLRYRQPIPQFGQNNANSVPMLLSGDIFVVGFGSEFLAGFDRRSGALLWGRDFSHVLQPVWDAEFDGLVPKYTLVLSAFERAPRAIELLVRGLTDDRVGSYCHNSGGSWVIRIDPKNGSVLTWSRVGISADSTPVADETGTFAFEDFCDPDPESGRYSEALRWVHTDGGQLNVHNNGLILSEPLAAYSGTIIGAEHQWESPSMLRGWSEHAGGSRDPIDSAASAYTAFVLGPSGGFGSVSHPDGGAELISIDSTGAVRTRFELPADHWLVSEPLLTSFDGAVIAVGNPTWLLGFSPEEESFACRLDGGAQYPSSVGLSNGLFITLGSRGIGTLLEAYDVGPLQLATSGWVCPGGNPQHTLRALP